MEFGILLQHFGPDADRESVIKAAPLLEDLGFDSLWVRDHLMFQPHGFEPGSTRFMEPFTTLGAIGALTERVKLGTAVAVPFRHPLVTSQLYGGIASAAGGDRIIAGLGAGALRKPFEVTGKSFENRVLAVQETAEILRLTWQGSRVSYGGQLFQFEDVLLDPTPDPNTPIWYGGASAAAVRRSLDYADGWLAGRCPLPTFDTLVDVLRSGTPASGKAMTVAISPVVSVAESRSAALAYVDVDGLLEEARSHRYWVGPFDTVEDLSGLLLAGSPSDCVEQVLELAAHGADHVMFDLRFRPSDFESQARLIAEKIIPAVRQQLSHA